MDVVTEQDVKRAYNAWMQANEIAAVVSRLGAENAELFWKREEQLLTEYERIYNAFQAQQEKE